MITELLIWLFPNYMFRRFLRDPAFKTVTMSELKPLDKHFIDV